MSKKIKIYTKGGDKGKTSLVSGSRVLKSNIRLQAYGEMDELNCFVGLVLTDHFFGDIENIEQKSLLLKIQRELFNMGSWLATEKKNREKYNLPCLNINLVLELEKNIDLLTEELPLLKNFILPGGGLLSAHLNICRVVCRRAERSIVLMNQEELNEVPQEVLTLINRLSDYFFVLGRWANLKENIPETIWSHEN